MKIFLDDLREPPDESWTLARTSGEFLALIDSGGPIEAISFDNDLGPDEPEGYEILKRIAKYKPELLIGEQDIEFHSANPSAVENMGAFLSSCRTHREDLLEQKNRPHPFGEWEEWSTYQYFVGPTLRTHPERGFLFDIEALPWYNARGSLITALDGALTELPCESRLWCFPPTRHPKAGRLGE